MTRCLLKATIVLGTLTGTGLAATPSPGVAEVPMRPFAVEWRAEPQSPVDLSPLLHAPAGKDGFLAILDGHLAEPGGPRIRLWGVNITTQAGTPPKEDAPIVAANLARLGVNCVRLHFLDRPAPSGLLDASGDDTRRFDAGQLDRLDYFIAQLKQRGIYTDLNLNVGRSYKPGDGVRDCELLGYAKSLTYFDPRIIELQKEYARGLLTHVNPYTNSEYRHEPAVALVELVNENSLVEAWFGSRLLGQHTTKNPGTWTDIPASYAADLTERYNAWLKDRYSAEILAAWRREAGVAAGEPIPRLTPAEFAKASSERFHAEASFYLDVERTYFLDMQRFLREELDIKPLLLGNSDHGHGRTGYPQLAGTSLLDVVDSHVYWQHPNYITDPKTGRQIGFEIPNTPMVDDPLGSSVVQLSRSAFAGKPFTVSEVNHPFPNEFACEGIPILAAYAALQDWDGIFWYTLGHRDIVPAEPVVKGHFDLAHDPVKMCQLAAGALAFLRGDIEPARQCVERTYTVEQVRESIRLPWSERPYFTPGFPLSLPLQHAVRIGSFDGPATGPFPPGADGPIRSDTDQLAWSTLDGKSGLVTANAPRWQAMIGFCKDRRTQGENLATDNLAVDVDNTFCAITLSAISDRPIAQANRLLLTACGRVANTAMQWNEARKSLTDWGTAPTVIESISGHVVLRNLADARAVTAQALDGGGVPFGPIIDARQTDEGWRLPIGEPATTWYLITVTR